MSPLNVFIVRNVTSYDYKLESNHAVKNNLVSLVVIHRAMNILVGSIVFDEHSQYYEHCYCR